MALSSCYFSSRICVSLKIDRQKLLLNTSCNNNLIQKRTFALKGMNADLFDQQVVRKKVIECIGWSFLGGSKIINRPNLTRNFRCKKSSAVYASWFQYSQIASSAFTLGTAAVLPFYTFMVLAPRADLTKKLVASSIPYILLGVLYAYLLYLSWTPDTIRLMFASKYWLPELPGIAKMFSSEMTLASAWIHLLAVDLFAARQVYYDGLQDNIETRHSVSLCLLFCPIGILTHFITKAVTRRRGETTDKIH